MDLVIITHFVEKLSMAAGGVSAKYKKRKQGSVFFMYNIHSVCVYWVI